MYWKEKAHCTHGKATATVTVTTEREEEGIVVLLSFVCIYLIRSTRPACNTDNDIIANDYLSYRRVPNRYCSHTGTHGNTPATATASTEREEEGTVVLLSFVWFPLDNILFIAPYIQYTESDITSSRMGVTLSYYHPCTKSRTNNQQHHLTVRICME